MNKFFDTIANTFLIVALGVLFAIPVIVFGGFSPVTPETKFTAVFQKKPDVLGATTIKEVTGADSYRVELLPNGTSDIQIEQLKNTESEYSFKTMIAPRQSGDENLIRIVNNSKEKLKVTFSIEDYSNKTEFIKSSLLIDNTAISLADMIEEPVLEPGLTLDAGEWVTIGVSLPDIKSPLTFDLTTQFWTEK